MGDAGVLVGRAGRGTRLRLRRRFYIGLALLMTLIVAVGFWPSYFSALVHGATARPWLIHVHGAVYVGWMALLIVQALLAARGRMAAHRSLGTIGIGYGVLVFLIGIAVTFVAPAMHVSAGEWTLDEAATFLVLPLGDMVLFGGFFGAAVAYRHRPEIHKRLMVLATVAVVFAAVARMNAVGVPVPVLLAVWYLPVACGIAYDWARTRQVHPVYVIGVLVMTVALARIPFGETALWRDFGRALLTLAG